MSRSAHIQRWMDGVASLGCLICGQPAQLHHIREGEGAAQRAPDALVVPLCSTHHHPPEGIHQRKTFYMRHRLDELDLLALTIDRMARRI